MRLFLALVFSMVMQSVVIAVKPVRLEYYLQTEMPISPQTSEVCYRLVIPTNIKNRQAVKIEYTLKPTREFEDKGTHYAEWIVNDFSEKREIGVTIKAVLYQYDISTIRRSRERLGKDDFKLYTSPEKWVESDSPKIIKALAEIRDNKSYKIMVERILKYVTQTMKYSGYNSDDLGAVAALIKKEGDCNEYSDLFIALCRAKGIPARSISGVSTNWGVNDTPKHSRAEVFLADYGWVPIDPLWSDIGVASFKKTPSFLQMSNKRVDEVLRKFYYWGYTVKGVDPKLKSTIKLTKSGHLNKLPCLAEY